MARPEGPPASRPVRVFAGGRMKKRTAEKVISRSILGLARYRKSTYGSALRRRPRFWTVNKVVADTDGPPSKRMRLEFDDVKGASLLTLEYADPTMALSDPT
jgi:hypothetical protein